MAFVSRSYFFMQIFLHFLSVVVSLVVLFCVLTNLIPNPNLNPNPEVLPLGSLLSFSTDSRGRTGGKCPDPLTYLLLFHSLPLKLINYLHTTPQQQINEPFKAAGDSTFSAAWMKLEAMKNRVQRPTRHICDRDELFRVINCAASDSDRQRIHVTT